MMEIIEIYSHYFLEKLRESNIFTKELISRSFCYVEGKFLIFHPWRTVLWTLRKHSVEITEFYCHQLIFAKISLNQILSKESNFTVN